MTDGRTGWDEAVRFAPLVRLTKGEVFVACQALADADRCLVRAGRRGEADALADLFDLLEARLVDAPGRGRHRVGQVSTE